MRQPCILEVVRWASTIGLLLAAGTAHGRPAPAPPPPHGEPHGELWRDVVEPHGRQVAAILAKARNAVARASEVVDGDDAVDRRSQYLDDAYGMLRYARRLSPENPDVLGLLGTTADELGKTRQALDALETCVRLQGPERASVEV